MSELIKAVDCTECGATEEKDLLGGDRPIKLQDGVCFNCWREREGVAVDYRSQDRRHIDELAGVDAETITVCAECSSVVPANERTEEGDDGQPLCGDCYARLYAARDAEDARWAYGDARYDQAREDGRRW